MDSSKLEGSFHILQPNSLHSYRSSPIRK